MNYKNHKGGMGAVLSIYANNIYGFKFICTYSDNYSTLLNAVLFPIRFVKILGYLLFDRKIEIVHMHSASRGSFYRKYLIFLCAKYCFSKKIVFHLHGGEFHLFFKNANSITKRIIKHLMHNADYVVCLSSFWCSFLKSTFGIDNISIVNNPVEAPLIYTQSAYHKPVSFLFLGKVCDNKGVFDLLRLLAHCREDYEGEIFLSICGPGEIEKAKMLIVENRLEGIVECKGWVEGDSKNKLLAECDVFILPSYNEGLPIAVLEAMSYGKAILSTAVGGIPEIVTNDLNGFLFEPGNMHMLKQRIDAFIDDPFIIERMGVSSRIKIEPYLIANVIKQLENLYTEILNA